MSFKTTLKYKKIKKSLIIINKHNFKTLKKSSLDIYFFV